MTTAASVDYAAYLSVHSVAAPIVLAVVYGFLLLFNIFNYVRLRGHVLLFLCLFCQVRIVAFSLRAAIADNYSAAHSKGTLVAFLVMFNIGFFALLYAAYDLMLERSRAVGLPYAMGRRLQVHRVIFHFGISGAVGLGSAGACLAVLSTKQAGINTGNTLREASAFVFLGLSALLAIEALICWRSELSVHINKGSFGAQHGGSILAVMALFLMIREAFIGATQHDINTQYNEHLWYPLTVLPELLAVLLFAVPGLIQPSGRRLAPDEEKTALHN